MDRDASLDDFLGSDDESADDTAADRSATTAPPDAGQLDDDRAVDPATSTSAWTTDGVCDSCGEPAQRRWREDDALVCGACASW